MGRDVDEKNPQSGMKRKIFQFTLIELLVVVSILVILLALLLPALNKARERGEAITCLNNLKELSLVMQSYANDWNGYTVYSLGGKPWTSALRDAGYWKDYRELFLFCPKLKEASMAPSSSLQYTTYGAHKVWTVYINDWIEMGFGDFVVETLADGSSYFNLPKVKRPSELLLFADTANLNKSPLVGSWTCPVRGAGTAKELQSFHHDLRSNVAFVDGHAGALSPAAMRKIGGNQGIVNGVGGPL